MASMAWLHENSAAKRLARGPRPLHFYDVSVATMLLTWEVQLNVGYIHAHIWVCGLSLGILK